MYMKRNLSVGANKRIGYAAMDGNELRLKLPGLAELTFEEVYQSIVSNGNLSLIITKGVGGSDCLLPSTL